MHGNSFGTSVNYAILKEQLVPGEESQFVDFCCPDVEAHIAQVRMEFAGQPELFAYHASLIIKLRRAIDVEAAYPAFVHLWRHERAFLLENLDSRWLVSALDTFADHGTVCERMGALGILSFMNMLKLAQTEHMLCGSPVYTAEEI